MGKSRSSISAGMNLTRVFHAPRSLVWKAWTEAERLARWWGPPGFTSLVQRISLFPEGLYLYCMRSPEGRDLWGKFTFREIIEPERLVFVSSFSNAQGETKESPFNPNWPLEVLNILTFAGHLDKTIMALHEEPINATEEEREIFFKNVVSIQQGFKGTFDNLEHYLENILQGTPA